jgi:hypothetical protein
MLPLRMYKRSSSIAMHCKLLGCEFELEEKTIRRGPGGENVGAREQRAPHIFKRLFFINPLPASVLHITFICILVLIVFPLQ